MTLDMLQDVSELYSDTQVTLLGENALNKFSERARSRHH
jgi:hypothetical protein